MMRRIISGIAIAVTLALNTAHAHATVKKAVRGKFAGVVTITGKTANAMLKVEQSDKPGGTAFVNTGFKISTDASGNGTVKIPNVSSGTLLTGHTVRVGSNTKTVTASKKWFPSATVGFQALPEVRLAQATDTGDGGQLVESWDTDSIWTLRLDPAEGSWTDLGAAVVSQGDLVAQIMSVSSQEVVVSIITDAGASTVNDLVLSGLGLTVHPGVTALHPQVGLLGGSSTWIDGVEVGAALSFGATTFVDAAPIPTPTPATMGLAALAALVAARRRR